MLATISFKEGFSSLSRRSSTRSFLFLLVTFFVSCLVLSLARCLIQQLQLVDLLRPSSVGNVRPSIYWQRFSVSKNRVDSIALPLRAEREIITKCLFATKGDVRVSQKNSSEDHESVERVQMFGAEANATTYRLADRSVNGVPIQQQYLLGWQEDKRKD